MQHDIALKKLNFDLLILRGGGGGGGCAKYLLPCGCIFNSLKIDMQQDHVLKKWKFYLSNSPKSFSKIPFLLHS